MNDRLEITPEIAEFCGVISGDGHLSRYISSRRTDYRIDIFGNKTEDFEYFKYLSLLFNNLFNKKLKLKIKEDCAVLYIHSKLILEFFENLGIIVGNKANRLVIPKVIINNNSLSLYFLRGLADTDFSINFKKGGRKNNSYPRIVCELASKNLIEDIKTVLDRVGIGYYQCEVIRNNKFGEFLHYRLEINGRKNLDRWINLIGFSNPKHISKIEVWKKLGYCPPNTTFSQRLDILKKEERQMPPY